MNIPINKPATSAELKDFWDSLQMDIMSSAQKLTIKDYVSLIERSFMFSIFFRGCPQIEMIGFQNILGIKDNGYVLLLELNEQNKTKLDDLTIDEFELHHFIKNTLNQVNSTVGPMITNRIIIFISETTLSSDHRHRTECFTLGCLLSEALQSKYQLSVTIGIGSMKCIHSIYSSFIEALSCIYYSSPNQISYYSDLKHKEVGTNFDYVETEQYLLEAIRLRKTEAYDYFSLMMDWIRPLNDDTKRNKILELLVLASHAMRVDSQSDTEFLSHTKNIQSLILLEGTQLIEFAFQRFIYITGYVKPQNSIDYSNHIVQATKDYLESHYTEDISLEDMAEQVNISPQYFSKLIKKTTGFNFIDWLSMLRVKKAKELLNNSNYTVKEVCFMVGYKDPNYFSRIFKKRIGITPSEYVKNSSYLNNKS